MTTKEAFERLAKCGVGVTNLVVFRDTVMYDLGGGAMHRMAEDDHVSLMLEAAVLRKWPGWQTSHATSMEAGRPTEEQWTVWRYGDVIGSAPTRLAALVLAAEKASLP